MNFHIDVVLWTFLSKSSIHSIHFAWEFFGSELQKMVWLFILLFCQKCIFLEIYVTLFKKVLQKKRNQFNSFRLKFDKKGLVDTWLVIYNILTHRNSTDSLVVEFIEFLICRKKISLGMWVQFSWSHVEFIDLTIDARHALQSPLSMYVV